MKMTDEQRAEIERLTTGPVLRTREGCRARVALLSLGQRARVAYVLGLVDPHGEALARALHERNHKRRIRRRST